MKTKLFVATLILCLINNVSNGQSCYRADAKHTGCYESANLGDKLNLAWKFKTNGKVFSSPVIYKSTLFIGSNDSCLYAINKTDGKLMWKFKTGGAISSSAAVLNNTVYINSFDGFVYALNAGSGKLVWKFDTGGEKVFQAINLHGSNTGGKIVEDPWDMYLSSPVTGGNNVYVGSGNGYFFALNATSGKLAWKFKTNGVIHSSPALSGDSVYIASWDSYIYSLNANTGKEYWRFKTGEDSVYHNQVGFQSSSAISGRILYIGCRDAKMRAIDRFTGKLSWMFSADGSWIISAPAICNNRVYFGTSDSYRLLSLNALTGAIIFDKPAKTYVFSSPAIANNKLYVGTFGGFLYQMDCTTGKTSVVYRTDASIENGKTYLNADSTFNNTKIFTSQTWDGMLQGVDRLYSVGSILSSPAISEKKLYFGSADGYVYALE